MKLSEAVKEFRLEQSKNNNYPSGPLNQAYPCNFLSIERAINGFVIMSGGSRIVVQSVPELSQAIEEFFEAKVP